MRAIPRIPQIMSAAMHCPFCHAHDTKVIDSRLVAENAVRRRRECQKCGERYTTFELQN